ncbi:MAG TPA: DUF2075 domain-containing protein [Puia sp.]|nr:DUF2075 domain-containing protein [Puia sp.]
MIVYQGTKARFSEDVLTNSIDTIISSHIKKWTGKATAKSEMAAFKNSLEHMDRVLQDREIPDDCGISVEYHIPQTSKRVDFIISGNDGTQDCVVIVELKQWSMAELSSRDGLIRTRLQGHLVETSHPSYQAWAYAALMHSFNATIEDEAIQLRACAYLHNYEPDDIITNAFYHHYLERAPAFLKPDAGKLRGFIRQYIKQGDNSDIVQRINNGKIRPSKSLADSLRSIMEGNQEFIMIDDQKVVYETAMDLAIHSDEKRKNVLIVEGGPGTGKSVVAINLLVDLTRRYILTHYVTKTSAPREVYFDKLQGVRKMAELRNLFVGSGSFMKTVRDSIPALIVDEAHRLTKQTGFLKMGDNQVKEIIDAAYFSVFFIDEDQRVHIDDYGNVKTIERIANAAGAKVAKMTLSSQFRCNGSDGYLAWLDEILQIRETANEEFSSDFEFDFKVVDSPAILRDMIFEKNKVSNKARLVAGYCWDWNSDKNPDAYDICFPEYDFKMRWNLKAYGSTWIIDPNSVQEVGCIHTCQGLEVDYIGVIVGEDLIFRDGQVLVDPGKRSKMDKSISGYKRRMKEKPEETRKLVRTIIKNTYRTLMTRGMKGCYLYCTDKQLDGYIKDRLAIAGV